MALLHGASRFVLDESFNGLDPLAQEALRRELLALRDGGATILLSTHRLAEVERFADRYIVLAAGRVRAQGTMVELAAAAGLAGSPTLEQAYLALTRA